MSRKNTRSSASVAADPAVDARKNLPAQARALVAHARNDITLPVYTGRMQPLDDTLVERGGGKGLKIYDEIERDTWAGSVLDKRKKQLTAREWRVEPANDPSARDIEAAAVVRQVFESLPFDRICEDLLDATLKGFAISEVVWARDGTGIWPQDVVAHDQRRFVFDEDWRPRLLTMANMYLGEELPERKFIVHRFGVKGNNPYGLGLGSSLFWPVLFKREGIAFWMLFLDKFAGPTVVGETPFGSLPEVDRKTIDALAGARTSSAILVPTGTNTKFLEASKSGSITYRDFLEYWDKQISIRVNGETLSTDIGSSGSRAAAETHADQLGLLVDGDSDLLSATLRDTLIRWIVDYNVPGARLPSIWRERPADAQAEAETRKAEAEAAAAANSALRDVLQIAAKLRDDVVARKFILASGLVGDLDDDVIDALVTIRGDLREAPSGDAVPGKPAGVPGVPRAPVPVGVAPRLPGVTR